MTDSEWRALGPALANNNRPDFSTEDIVRLVHYRRAILNGGMYASREMDQTPMDLVFDMEYLRTGKTS